MFVFNVWIVCGDLVKHFVKEAIGKLHDVVFRKASDFFAIVAARIFKGMSHNLFRSRTRNQLQTLKHLFSLPVLDTGIEILFIFTNDHDVHNRMFGIDEGMIGNAGANVGVKAQRLANGHVQALVAATLGRGNGRFKKDFCAAQRFPGAGLNTRTIAGQINFLADIYCFYFEVCARFFENMQGRRHDLRPDAVAMRDGDWYRFSHIEIGPFAN